MTPATRTSLPPVDAGPLDAADRALLDLSVGQRLSDEDIAARLEMPATEVAERRERVLAAVMLATTDAPQRDESLTARSDAVLREAAVTAPASPVMPAELEGTRVDFLMRVLAGAYLVGLLVAVVAYKAAFAPMLIIDPVFGTYGIVVVTYIVSRFVLSAFYRSHKDAGLEPRVAIVMPGFNEQDAIANSLRSILAVDYPAEKLEIVAVNDGSTDDTLAEMRVVEAEARGRVRVIDFVRNQGKRAAMAAGIRATDAEIVAFVDSDSVLEPDALRILVQGFADPKVGALCGHANVLNLHDSWMTKMQAVRYFVAFKVSKAAESVFNAVTCCSGCFSAYRREAILPHLDWWENQTFLGRPSTFGDDRSLTNCVLRSWKVRYESRAVAHTIVPDDFRVFMKQQLRWKRSWTRESLIVGSFIWRKHPLAALASYVGILLPLVAPVVAVRCTVFNPIVQGGGAPLVYILGIYAMAVAYGLYWLIRQTRYSSLWIYGVGFCLFYVAFLLWQTYYAIATARSSSWGTRPATAGSTADAGAPVAADGRLVLAEAPG